MRSRLVALLLVAPLVSSCSGLTLGPAVQSGAVEYGADMDAFTNQALLTNILRARDYAPLNFSDLSSVTGSFSLQGTSPLTDYFGPGPRTSKASIMPGLTYSVSPSITLATLNTEGFMLTMIQPISTTYILNKWNEGIDHRLLLYLFVKSIKFCNDSDDVPNAPPVCQSASLVASDPLKEALDKANAASTDISKAQTAKDAAALKAALKSAADDAKATIDQIGDAQKAEDELSSMLKPALDELEAITDTLKKLAPGAAPSQAVLKQMSDAIAHVSTELGAALKNPPESTCTGPKNPRRIHINNPDDPDAMADFESLVDCLVDAKNGDVDLKMVTILDPLGNPVPFGETISAVYPPSGGGDGGSNLGENPGNQNQKHATGAQGQGAGRTDGDAGGQGQATAAPGATPPSGVEKPPTSGTKDSLQDDAKSGDKGPPAFPLPAPGNIATTNAQTTLATDLNIISTIGNLSDGQLHVGNAKCPSYLTKNANDGTPAYDYCLHPRSKTSSYVQLYKEYPGLVEVCVNVDPDSGEFDGHVITPVSESELEAALKNNKDYNKLQQSLADIIKQQNAKHPTNLTVSPTEKAKSEAENTKILNIKREISNIKKETKKQLVGQRSRIAPLMTSGSSLSTAKQPAPGSTPGASAAGAGGGGSGGGGTANSGGAMPQVSLALTPNRISAIISSQFCDRDQIVLEPSSEEQFDMTTAGFAHVEWRSIAEVIQYLGALARNEASAPKWPREGGVPKNRVFEVHKDQAGRISVNYGGKGATYSVGRDFDDRPDPGDHSLQDLALLNELIAIAKVSGSLPVPQPVQVLP